MLISIHSLSPTDAKHPSSLISERPMSEFLKNALESASVLSTVDVRLIYIHTLELLSMRKIHDVWVPSCGKRNDHSLNLCTYKKCFELVILSLFWTCVQNWIANHKRSYHLDLANSSPQDRANHNHDVFELRLASLGFLSVSVQEVHNRVMDFVRFVLSLSLSLAWNEDFVFLFSATWIRKILSQSTCLSSFRDV